VKEGHLAISTLAHVGGGIDKNLAKRCGGFCHRLCHPIIREWVPNPGTSRDDQAKKTNQINPSRDRLGRVGTTVTLCKTAHPGSIPGVASST
jgi:hypothetical protein